MSVWFGRAGSGVLSRPGESATKRPSSAPGRGGRGGSGLGFQGLAGFESDASTLISALQ